jgi:hypothetical protein
MAADMIRADAACLHLHDIRLPVDNNAIVTDF